MLSRYLLTQGFEILERKYFNCSGCVTSKLKRLRITMYWRFILFSFLRIGIIYWIREINRPKLQLWMIPTYSRHVTYSANRRNCDEIKFSIFNGIFAMSRYSFVTMRFVLCNHTITAQLQSSVDNSKKWRFCWRIKRFGFRVATLAILPRGL